MTVPKKLAVLALAFLLIPSLFSQDHKLVFAAQWLPQAQFAGYYVAKEKGFYDQAGLKVEIIHPSASVSPTQFLADGRADIISLFLTSAMNNRQKGIDLVNIAQISQHSAIMFVTLKKNGIDNIKEFNGKKIGVWYSGFDEIPKALVKKEGLDVEWVPILSSVNLFMMGGIDIMTVMWYNEYDQIYLSGVNRDELNTFFLSDYGFDVPEDGLYVLRNTAVNKKDDLKAFVEATIKGWQYAAENRDYAISLVIREMNKANVPANIPHQKWMLDKIIGMQSLTENNKPDTELHIDDFEKAIDIMRHHYHDGFNISYDDFYKPSLNIKN